MERPESPTQLVGAFGNRVLWHRMVASVVNNMHGILKETDKERERVDTRNVENNSCIGIYSEAGTK